MQITYKDINMASSYQKIGVLVLVLVFIATNDVAFRVSNAQSLCNVPTASLTECKPSVSGPKPTPPTNACCTAISHADLNCLCSYKKSQMLSYFGIDPVLATQLPAKCNIANAPKC